MAWSTVNQSDGPSSFPTCCFRSLGDSTVSVFISSPRPPSGFRVASRVPRGATSVRGVWGALRGPPSSTGESLALVGEAVEQRGGLPHVAVLALPLQHAIAHGFQSERVRPEHGPTPIHRPAVAVDPDHVDVAGPDGQL